MAAYLNKIQRINSFADFHGNHIPGHSESVAFSERHLRGKLQYPRMPFAGFEAIDAVQPDPGESAVFQAVLSGC